MAALVHLVRHAETDNPDHLVCDSIPGFGLSPHGLDQARRVGRYLGPRPVVAIWSSPMESSLRTAEEIAARSNVPVRVDPDLREWSITERWEGNPWQSVSQLFPGELEAYLDHPNDLDFASESLEQMADRVSDVARRLDREYPHGDVVIVSHQDAVRAGRLRLVGGNLSTIHDVKPGYGAVITLRPGPAWKDETKWEPGEAPRFGEKSDLRVLTPSEDPTQPAPA